MVWISRASTLKCLENWDITARRIAVFRGIAGTDLGFTYNMYSIKDSRYYAMLYANPKSAKRREGWSAVIYFWGNVEDSRLSLSIKKELSIQYTYWIGSLRRNHECGGKTRGYRPEVSRRIDSQFWEFENLSLRRWRVSSSSIQSLQKWIEWLWSTMMIAETLSISLGVYERHRLSNYVSRLRAGLSIRYHFCASAVRRSTSTSRIIFQNRDLILSSLRPSPSPIYTHRDGLSKTQISHHLNSASWC
jgi:hypothetical protein